MTTTYDFVVSGGGISGVVISKYLKENGISFLTLEKRDSIGGIWSYTDNENITTVNKNTITTSGKRFTLFSDFTPKEEWTQLLKWSQVLEHINDYAKHYQILENVELNSEIVAVEKREDGLWHVEYRSTSSGLLKCVRSKNFVVAGGAFSERLTPIKDRFGSVFDGEIYHGQQTKLNGSIAFRGKRVLVTGAGETAADVAMHAACVAERTSWAIPGGLQSIDRCVAIVDRRHPEHINEILFDEGPSLLRNRNHTQHLSDKRYNNEYRVHSRLGANGHGVKEWVCDNYYYNKFPIKNGEVIYLVHEGRIQPYRQVVGVSGKRVEFDRAKFEEIDMIIECTGYKKSYKYLPDEFQEVDYRKLYRGFVHVDDPTLFMLGIVRPMIGSVPGFVEYQSQYVVDLFKKSIHLPPIETIQSRILADEEYHRKLTMGCQRFRPDVLDGYYYYPYVMSADMGRNPEDHLNKLPAEDREKVLNASYNAGLFLWIGDKRKERRFLESVEQSALNKLFRSALVKSSKTGRLIDPILRWLDRKVFRKKNAANMLWFGKGASHRNYLRRKRAPIAMGLLGDVVCGPFPLNHPYFTYKETSLYSSTACDKVIFTCFILALFSGLKFMGHLAGSDSSLSDLILVPAFAWVLLRFRVRNLRTLILIGCVHGLLSVLLAGGNFVSEALLFPIIYGVVIKRVVDYRRHVPALRPEVETMA